MTRHGAFQNGAMALKQLTNESCRKSRKTLRYVASLTAPPRNLDRGNSAAGTKGLNRTKRSDNKTSTLNFLLRSLLHNVCQPRPSRGRRTHSWQDRRVESYGLSICMLNRANKTLHLRMSMGIEGLMVAFLFPRNYIRFFPLCSDGARVRGKLFRPQLR